MVSKVKTLINYNSHPRTPWNRLSRATSVAPEGGCGYTQ